ncbi:MAG: hypothetical protein HYT36_01095 [Candidatus Staskawiczbacteria bacterium]|nr:hypothetical protein [Candidatus Staskawiczbacteria bacterium]
MQEIKTLLEAGKDLGKNFPEKVEIANGSIFLSKKYPLKENPQDKSNIPLFKKFNRDKLREKGWPVNPGTYEIRDPASPVAVVCPAQNAELQAAAISYGAAISGPCITPDRGVELVVTNLISNPNIRWLVIAGKDSGHFAGDVIWSLSRNGIDPKTRKVIGTKCPTNPYLMNIPLESIDRFQKQIKVINIMIDGKENDFEQVKEEMGLVIRCCVQEPENAIEMINRKTGEQFVLFDIGSEEFEAVAIDLSIQKTGTYYEGYDRVGTSIHIDTVASAYPVAISHVVNKGIIGKQESTRMALDTLATQFVIHNVEDGLVPENWRPFGWMKDIETVQDYIEKYRLWVYLFPLSDVKYDEVQKRFVPYIPKQMEYAYGGRLTAYWYEIADEEEKKDVTALVEEYHKKYQINNPTFKEIAEFYEKLSKLQKKSFNQIYNMAKAVKLCVAEGFTGSYRNYMSLQTPPIDIKADPRQAHNPCFALYEIYPRKIKGKWQLDVVLLLRANDSLAFPANANGGIFIQKFLAWYASIDTGLYVHNAGSLEVCDYMFDKDTLEKHQND